MRPFRKIQLDKDGPCAVFLGQGKRCLTCGWSEMNHSESMRKAHAEVRKSTKKSKGR